MNALNNITRKNTINVIVIIIVITIILLLLIIIIIISSSSSSSSSSIYNTFCAFIFGSLEGF